MSSRDQEARAFAELVETWGDLGGLAERHAQQREAAQREGEDDSKRAMASERAVKDQAIEVTERAARTGRHARALAASAGVQAAESPSSPALTSLEACAREITALSSDLRSAESAWKWVERTRRDATASTRGPSAPGPTPASTPTEELSTGGLDRRLRNVAIAVLLICVAIAAAIFLL